MATSYNHGAPFRAQTFPQYAPQLPQAQVGSYSPGGSIPPYGGWPNPGYKPPFQPNPYPSPAFTGMPQQPVYVTHIYNNPMPQQPQQQEQQQQPTSSLAKYNGMFTLLGGALKVAGAVLGPTLQNDWSSLTGN